MLYADKRALENNLQVGVQAAVALRRTTSGMWPLIRRRR